MQNYFFPAIHRNDAVDVVDVPDSPQTSDADEPEVGVHVPV